LTPEPQPQRVASEPALYDIEKHHPEFPAMHPELPLAFAYQMCNAVAHGYFKVDLGIVWKTIRLDLPGFCILVQNATASLKNDTD
jgi:uncharacterized protein with HEPN domain